MRTTIALSMICLLQIIALSQKREKEYLKNISVCIEWDELAGKNINHMDRQVLHSSWIGLYKKIEAGTCGSHRVAMIFEDIKKNMIRRRTKE